MSDWPAPITVEQMYGDWDIDEEAARAALDRSLKPRGPDSLFETFSGLGINPGDAVLDIGARDGRYCLELAARFDCRVVGVEPVEANLRAAASAIAEHAEGATVEMRPGVIEQIPAADDEFDAIWSRDMIVHVIDIDAALAECARVLRPGGAMLVYDTFATELMEPAELRRICADLAVVPERMSIAGFEEDVTRAGFAVEAVDVIGSEWRESWEEDGSHRTARKLLNIARLRRDRERLLAELGVVAYRVELGDAHWAVYQMLGKLEPRVYVLRLSSGP